MKKNIFRRRRVVMATIGSLGDLHPYIALALEMRGIPMLVVPFAHDQHDNGARVERLGVARTIARNSYKAGRVAVS